MKSATSYQQLLKSILSGAYTPLDVREFVQLCYTLAVPLIRKKIVSGKLNLHLVRLKESDVVYDCLADLFRRDAAGKFIEITAYFERHQAVDSERPEEEPLLLLRRLVFAHVNKNIIRLYSEVDPVLGKVLRNMRLAVEKTKLFREEDRFGETVLIPENADPLFSLPPIPLEAIERHFTRVVLLHDNALVMVTKLHSVLVGQNEYQRILPFVPAALIMKKVYQLGWEPERQEEPGIEDILNKQDLVALTRRVCAELGEKMRNTYVGKGKVTEEIFQKYLLVLEDILLGELGEGRHEDGSYFEQLKRHVPDLTKQTYARSHRKVLEYLAKTAKRSLREELRSL